MSNTPASKPFFKKFDNSKQYKHYRDDSSSSDKTRHPREDSQQKRIQPNILFQKSGILYTLQEEPTDDFYIRLAFIYRGRGKLSATDIEYRTKLAQCYVEYKLHGCKYSQDIMDMIQEIESM